MRKARKDQEQAQVEREESRHIAIALAVANKKNCGETVLRVSDSLRSLWQTSNPLHLMDIYPF